MNSQTTSPQPTKQVSWKRREAVYALLLFAVAAMTLTALTYSAELRIADLNLDTALFFLLFGLLTISIGYYHPNVGYYSFDRVAQVACILVLGPLPAAWVNGCASLLYPWHRLRAGTPLRDVLLASLHNAGLMSLTVLVCGSLYAALGGSIPLITIDGRSAMLLILLVFSMQTLNDLGMLAMLKAGRRETKDFFQPFAVALELGSSATAVLVAIVYNSMNLQLLILLLGVLTLGMLGLSQFAQMRLRLERLVEERTAGLHEKTRALEQLAARDNLTGLHNRLHAERALYGHLAVADEHEPALSVALGDIDFFKAINDRHLHGIGDEVLKTVAEILRARCRRSDVIARYGGDEFLICFPDTTLDEARKLCEELRHAVEQHDWERLGLTDAVTMSFGVAEAQPGTSAGQIVDMADQHLYAAKHAGRNRVVG